MCFCLAIFWHLVQILYSSAHMPDCMQACTEVLEGRDDGRKKGKRLPQAPQHQQLDTCMRFLQLRYHHDGESLPDKFHFDQVPELRGKSLVLTTPKDIGHPSGDNNSDSDSSVSQTQWEEQDARNLAALSLRQLVTNTPFQNALVGPGSGAAPRRWLGVVKPQILFEMMLRWHKEYLPSRAPPSFSTFRRALRSSKQFLAFRKSSGQHAVCDQCVWFKRELKRVKALHLRGRLIEQYAEHLLQNWRDRAADAAWVSLAFETRTLSLSSSVTCNPSSVLVIRSDGLDQAKHKVPRALVKSKTFDELVRPACHVQLIWIHGHGFSISVSDPDMKKDTAVHVDALARCLSWVHDTVGVPRNIFLLLDNTCRDNKNSKMIRFWIKLVAFNIVDAAHIGFPIKGHTHTCLDAVGGQAVTRCSHETFETANELTQVYQRFLDEASLESSCYFRKSWKHDSCPEWDDWMSEVPVVMKGLTGPKAPHLFRIMRRKMLSVKDLDHLEHALSPGHPDDIVVVCHSYMSSPKPFQVEVAVPGEALPSLVARFRRQPFGEHARRHVPFKVRQHVKTKANAALAKRLGRVAQVFVLKCFDLMVFLSRRNWNLSLVHNTKSLRQAISSEAHNFLVGWITGTLRREPHPKHYTFLDNVDLSAVTSTPVNLNPFQQDRPRPINVVQTDGSLCDAPCLTIKIF